MGHAIAGTFEDQQVSVVDQAVDHGGGHLLVGEDTAPFGELDVGGKYQALALVGVGDHPEQQLGAFLVHGDVSPFVQADEIGGGGGGPRALPAHGPRQPVPLGPFPEADPRLGDRPQLRLPGAAPEGRGGGRHQQKQDRPYRSSPRGSG